jgi:hypothetical protein
MSQLRLVASQSSNAPSKSTKLASVKCRMLRADSSNSLPSVAVKSARLHALNAAAADVIEKLVDDLLEELEGR